MGLQQKNGLREIIDRDKPVLLIGPEIHVTLDGNSTISESKVRAKIHQDFMMELIGKQREGVRMYVHEFPQHAGSMNTKESIHVRTNERNREGKSGKWTAGNNNSGDIMAMTNVPEILKEIQRFGNKASKRMVDMAKKKDSHGEDIFRAVMRGVQEA